MEMEWWLINTKDNERRTSNLVIRLHLIRLRNREILGSTTASIYMDVVFKPFVGSFLLYVVVVCPRTLIVVVVVIVLNS